MATFISKKFRKYNKYGTSIQVLLGCSVDRLSNCDMIGSYDVFHVYITVVICTHDPSDVVHRGDLIML